MEKPLLLVDVDGVLCPYFPDTPQPGYERLNVGAVEVWINPQHGIWLNDLATDFELVWATTWEHDAPARLGPALGLPDMPVIEFTQGAANKTWKLADVDAFVRDRPVAWIDDELGSDVDHWAEKRQAPTLLVHIEGTAGFSGVHVEQLRTFATNT